MDWLRRNSNPDAQGDGEAHTVLAGPLTYRSFAEVIKSGSLALATHFVQPQVNGKSLFNLPATVLDAMNQFDLQQAYAVDSVLKLGQQLYGANDPQLLDLINIVVGVPSPKTGRLVSSLQLQTDTSGSTNPVAVVASEVSEAAAGGPGMIRYINSHKFPIDSNGTEWTAPLVYGKPEASHLRRIFFKTASGNGILKVRMTWDNVPIWDADTVWAKRIQVDGGVRDPAAASDYFDLVIEWPQDGRAGKLSDAGHGIDFPFMPFGVDGAANSKALGFEVYSNDPTDEVQAWVEFLGASPK